MDFVSGTHGLSSSRDFKFIFDYYDKEHVSLYILFWKYKIIQSYRDKFILYLYFFYFKHIVPAYDTTKLAR
jgi:hypothetical protein